MEEDSTQSNGKLNALSVLKNIFIGALLSTFAKNLYTKEKFFDNILMCVHLWWKMKWKVVGGDLYNNTNKYNMVTIYDMCKEMGRKGITKVIVGCLRVGSYFFFVKRILDSITKNWLTFVLINRTKWVIGLIEFLLMTKISSESTGGKKLTCGWHLMHS